MRSASHHLPMPNSVPNSSAAPAVHDTRASSRAPGDNGKLADDVGNVDAPDGYRRGDPRLSYTQVPPDASWRNAACGSASVETDPASGSRTLTRCPGFNAPSLFGHFVKHVNGCGVGIRGGRGRRAPRRARGVPARSPPSPVTIAGCRGSIARDVTGIERNADPDGIDLRDFKQRRRRCDGLTGAGCQRDSVPVSGDVMSIPPAAIGLRRTSATRDCAAFSAARATSSSVCASSNARRLPAPSFSSCPARAAFFDAASTRAFASSDLAFRVDRGVAFGGSERDQAEHTLPASEQRPWRRHAVGLERSGNGSGDFHGRAGNDEHFTAEGPGLRNVLHRDDGGLDAAAAFQRRATA